jgi:hypothetical protein
MKRIVFSVVGLCIFYQLLFADESMMTPAYREYDFIAGDFLELEFIANTGHTMNKLFQDLYYRGFGKNMHGKMQPWVDGVWYVYWTYFWSLYPHEFGHKTRARQVGGDFIFEGFTFPFPRTRMELPDNLDDGEKTLSVIGGFEINNLMRCKTHMDFYEQNYAFADELVHSFIQEVYYPFYTLIVAPARVNKAATWTETRGDPVEYILSVYQKYYDRPAIREDGSVDPDLIGLYRESFLLNIAWTLMDPMLYCSFKAFRLDARVDDMVMRPKMFGDQQFAWIWGTLFNATPLGYELYLNNYFRLRGRLLKFYIRGGRPYENLGAGIQMPNIIDRERLKLGVAADVWKQDIYGDGINIALEGRYYITSQLGIVLKTAWKQPGYLLGRRVDESALIMGGISWRFPYE